MDEGSFLLPEEWVGWERPRVLFGGMLKVTDLIG